MDKWKINGESVTAFVRLGVAALVTGFAMVGVEIDGSAVENAVLGAASVAVLVWVWWKNNNVTDAAQEAQKVLDEIEGNK